MHIKLKTLWVCKRKNANTGEAYKDHKWNQNETNILKKWSRTQTLENLEPRKKITFFLWGGGTLNLGSPHGKNRAVPLRHRTLGTKNINYFRDLCTFKHGYPTLHIFWLPWMNKSPWQPHNAITLTFIWVTSLCNFSLTALPRHSRVFTKE